MGLQARGERPRKRNGEQDVRTYGRGVSLPASRASRTIHAVVSGSPRNGRCNQRPNSLQDSPRRVN